MNDRCDENVSSSIKDVSDWMKYHLPLHSSPLSQSLSLTFSLSHSQLIFFSFKFSDLEIYKQILRWHSLLLRSVDGHTHCGHYMMQDEEESVNGQYWHISYCIAWNYNTYLLLFITQSVYQRESQNTSLSLSLSLSLLSNPRSITYSLSIKKTSSASLALTL